jgi:hypothetical protein
VHCLDGGVSIHMLSNRPSKVLDAFAAQFVIIANFAV